MSYRGVGERTSKGAELPNTEKEVNLFFFLMRNLENANAIHTHIYDIGEANFRYD